jgi:3-oxoacyl-[acyl-carrier protein] reductase
MMLLPFLERYMDNSSGIPRRVALITGGSRGIGRRIAERLSAQGHAVVIGYRTSADEAD